MLDDETAADRSWADAEDRHRPPSRFRSPGLTAGLAVALAVLLAVAALAGGLIQVPGASPSASPEPSGSPSPAISPTPTNGPTGEPSASPGEPTPSPEPTFLTHTVARGETLTMLARRYETDVLSISFWNRAIYPTLDPHSAAYAPNAIQVGWALRILPGGIVDPSTQPTPSPGPATPPPATASPVPTPTTAPGAPATVISHGSRSSKQVALTLDMGGRLDPALDIMNWLVANNVRATIFPTGRSGTETTTGRAVLQIVADHPSLFAVANHSWNHPDFRTLTAAQMADQLNQTETAIGGLIGRSTKPWFRPPYGGWNDTVRAGVGAAGWRYLVMWDIDTIDWRPTADGGPTADDIVTKVLSRAQGGSIVLMHLGGYNTFEALPRIVAGLKAQGFELVTLAAMAP